MSFKYAGDQGVCRLEKSFGTDLGKARELAENTALTIFEDLALEDEKLLETVQCRSPCCTNLS